MESEPNRSARPRRLGFPGINFSRPPDMVATYSVFVSSANEMAPMRRRIEELLEKAINPPLRDRVRAQLLPQMWERAQAQQQQPGRDANEIFVEKALESHATIALFRRRLRSGTEQEVTALLEREPDERDPISVIRFSCDSGEDREPDLDAFFELLDEHDVHWQDTGAFDSDEAWHSLVKVLAGLAFAAFDAALSEERPDVI